MASPLPTVAAPQGLSQIAQLISALAPQFGTGKTTSVGGESSSISPESNDQMNALLAKIMGDANGPDIDNMVSNILDQAKNAFGPAAIESNAAGNRAYSDTTLKMMRDNAMAKATAQAAAVKLDALNTANKTAAGLVESKMSNTRTVTQTKTAQTGASAVGKAAGGLGLAAAAYSLFGKKKVPPKPGEEGTEPEQLGYSQDQLDSFTNDQSFSSGGANSGVSSDSLSAAGGDPNVALSRMVALESGALDPTLAEGDGTTVTAGPAMPPAIVDPSLVITPDNSSIESILGAQGIPTGAAMPGAILPGAQMPPAPIPGKDLLGDASEEAPTDAVDVIPTDLSNSFQVASLDTGTMSDVGGGLLDAGGESTALADEVGGDVGLGLPPGTFTILNALTDGEFSKTISSIPVVGDVFDGANEAGAAALEAGTDIIGGGADAVGSIFQAGGDLFSSVGDFFDDIF